MSASIHRQCALRTDIYSVVDEHYNRVRLVAVFVTRTICMMLCYAIRTDGDDDDDDATHNDR